jgi:hypothetical protein
MIARPGDDIQLEFGIRVGSNRNVIKKCLVEEKDYIAVYDKKMLWRANLYIDEGDSDWNNENPWDALLAKNDWNKDENGNLVTGDRAGKQVVDIRPWTKSNTGYMQELKGGTTTITVTDALPYGWCGVDEPFSTSAKLFEQKALLGAKFDSKGDLLPNPIGNAVAWSSTLAPKKSWTNYVDSTVATINNVEYHSYRPGYSTERRFGTIGQNNFDANENQLVRESIGMDCSGFLTKSVSYPGNNYAVPDLPLLADTWTTRNSTWSNGHRATNELKPEANQYTWLIWSHDIRSDLTQYPQEGDETIPSSVPLEPGDLMFIYDGDRVTTNHVAIVQDVRRQADGSIKFSDVTLIEAASGYNRQYKVLNKQTFWGYVRNSFDFQPPAFGRISFARLKTQ